MSEQNNLALLGIPKVKDHFQASYLQNCNVHVKFRTYQKRKKYFNIILAPNSTPFAQSAFDLILGAISKLFAPNKHTEANCPRKMTLKFQ